MIFDLHYILGQGVDPSPQPPGHRDTVLGISYPETGVASRAGAGAIPVLLLRRLLHQVIVNAARLDRVYQIYQRQSCADGRVLKGGVGGAVGAVAAVEGGVRAASY